MGTRRHILLLLAGALGSLGAAFRTTNFVVEAPTPQLAQQFGQAAEHWRREKAIDWLGQEMQPWPEPCPLKVRVTMGGAGGATQFAFDRGRVLGQHMSIEGSLDRLLVSVLPHEVTHTVFAYYFRSPVPRWADEGGAVLSEDDLERGRHDMLCRQILNTPGRHIPLRRLFALRDYPGDVMALYAEGFSVSNFLVQARGRQAFLAFVSYGMQRGWDGAALYHYGYNGVDSLERAWLDSLRNNRPPAPQLAGNDRPEVPQGMTQVMVRQTVPPAQPFAPAPIYRGQAPGFEQESNPPAAASVLTGRARPGYLPEADPRLSSPQTWPLPAAEAPDSAGSPRDPWQPAGAIPSRPPAVRLGAPQPASVGPAIAPSGVPPQASPVGYPGG